VEPGVVWDELNSFNEDIFEGRMKVESNPEKRWMKLKLADEESLPLEVKIKFYDLSTDGSDQNERRRLRIRFIKKRGDLL
jgi:hypothetical protein